METATDAAGTPIVLAKGGDSIAATPNGKTVYVLIISLKARPDPHGRNAALAPIPVGSQPFALVMTSDGRTLYVWNTVASATRSACAP